MVSLHLNLNLDFVFLILSTILLVSAISVILSKNPIHSVLFLIVVFVGSSGILLLLEAEFLGMIFLIIYIGAISVLFLFVIMMLNIRIIELRENLIKYVPLSIVICILLFVEFFYLYYNSISSISQKNIFLTNIMYFNNVNLLLPNATNLQLLGYILYTYFVEFFLICGVILFVAMIGAIMLTLHLEFSTKKQDLFLQISRNTLNTVKNIKIV